MDGIICKLVNAGNGQRLQYHLAKGGVIGHFLSSTHQCIINAADVRAIRRCYINGQNGVVP